VTQMVLFVTPQKDIRVFKANVPKAAWEHNHVPIPAKNKLSVLEKIVQAMDKGIANQDMSASQIQVNVVVLV